MPDFKICQVGKAADCSILYIEDQTTYGIAPEARANYALYLVGFFYVEEGEDTRLEIDNSDPTNVVTWEVPSSSDGYIYFDLLPIRIWDASLGYSIGDIIYQNTFYWKALTNNSNQNPTNTEGISWEKVEDPYTEVDNLNDLNNPVIADVTRTNEFSLCRADICYGEVVAAAAKDCCDDCADNNNKNMMRVDVLIQAAYLLIAQTKYVEAHKLALLLQDVCNDLTDCGCS